MLLHSFFIVINKNKPNLIGGLGWHVGRYIGRLSRYLSTDYRWTVDWLLVDSRPIFDWYLTDTWPILDRYLTDTWPILGRYLTDTWPILDRYLTDTSPAVYCYISADASAVSRLIYWSTTDQLSTDYRRTINRLTVDSWPKVDRYISWLSADMSTKATYSTHDPPFLVQQWGASNGLLRGDAQLNICP